MVWYILLIVFILFLSCEFYALKTGVPTIASFPSARRTIIEILRTEIGDRPAALVDLGSGNGQLASQIARAFPQSQVTGIELSFIPWLISVCLRALRGPANLRYGRRNFWNYDCAGVDVVVLYVTENIMEDMGAKLRRELKAGAIIIANDTMLRGDWQPIASFPTGFLKMRVFLYRQT